MNISQNGKRFKLLTKIELEHELVRLSTSVLTGNQSGKGDAIEYNKSKREIGKRPYNSIKKTRKTQAQENKGHQ